METEFNVNDLIALSYGQQPIDFEQAFNSLITDRLAQAVEIKKTEIAQSMFNNQEFEDDDEELDQEQGEEDGETA